MKRLLAFVTLLTVSVAFADKSIDEFSTLLEGTFDTHAADPTLPAEDRLVSRYTRIDVPAMGEYVFYQQINHRADLGVYRQRILVLGVDDSGAIVQNALTLSDPSAWVDALPQAFSELTSDDVREFMSDGCEQTFVANADGFHGRVDPATCVITSSRTGKLRGIGAEAILSATTLKLAERGFDAETGEQLFGTEPGDYIELRRTDSQ